jgi:hypothetical protein
MIDTHLRNVLLNVAHWGFYGSFLIICLMLVIIFQGCVSAYLLLTIRNLLRRNGG